MTKRTMTKETWKVASAEIDEAYNALIRVLPQHLQPAQKASAAQAEENVRTLIEAASQGPRQLEKRQKALADFQAVVNRWWVRAVESLEFGYALSAAGRSAPLVRANLAGGEGEAAGVLISRDVLVCGEFREGRWPHRVFVTRLRQGLQEHGTALTAPVAKPHTMSFEEWKRMNAIRTPLGAEDWHENESTEVQEALGRHNPVGVYDEGSEFLGVNLRSISGSRGPESALNGILDKRRELGRTGNLGPVRMRFQTVPDVVERSVFPIVSRERCPANTDLLRKPESKVFDPEKVRAVQRQLIQNYRERRRAQQRKEA